MLETKTTNLKNVSETDIQNRVINEKYLGWELISSSVTDGFLGKHNAFLTFARNPDTPYLERKKQIDENIQELDKLIEQCEEKIKDKEYKSDSGIGRFLKILLWMLLASNSILLAIALLGLISPGFANIFTGIMEVGSLKYIIILIFLIILIAGIVALLIVLKRHYSTEKEEELIQTLVSRIDNYYQEAKNLDEKGVIYEKLY